MYYVVTAIDYNEHSQRLQDRYSAPEASVSKNVQNISAVKKRNISRGVPIDHPMQEHVVHIDG